MENAGTGPRERQSSSRQSSESPSGWASAAVGTFLRRLRPPREPRRVLRRGFCALLARPRPARRRSRRPPRPRSARSGSSRPSSGSGTWILGALPLPSAPAPRLRRRLGRAARLGRRGLALGRGGGGPSRRLPLAAPAAARAAARLLLRLAPRPRQRLVGFRVGLRPRRRPRSRRRPRLGLRSASARPPAVASSAAFLRGARVGFSACDLGRDRRRPASPAPGRRASRRRCRRGRGRSRP